MYLVPDGQNPWQADCFELCGHLLSFLIRQTLELGKSISAGEKSILNLLKL